MGTLEGLNREQQEAVCHFQGPLLILAGAGSGKTRVLTNRIAWLIEEKNVNPWNIMAITFTNKAAGEMRERVDRMVGFGADSVWVTTFHSTCVRILRRYIDRLGYGTNFTIYDGDDQKTLMKDICKRLQIDTKVYKERSLLAAISSAKDELIGPEEYKLNAQGDFTKMKIALVYEEYQRQLRQNNALDFDDLIVKTVELFQHCGDVLDYYQERFRFIMVDEYQDTNTAQFRLVSTLASKYKNLCVVGDDDQSIYKFRGANIGNILNFEKFFPEAKVIKLEQNYRSTQNILDAANAVIANNRGRKEKSLWTANGAGDKVNFRQFFSAYEEAEYIADDIGKKVRQGKYDYRDCAVLYRTNAQSRLFEEKFLFANIPYKIIGGINFYARKEIKDLLAYLKTVDNARDDLAVKRIINVPKRGIGAATISKVQDYAEAHGMSFYDGLKVAQEIPGLGRGASKTVPFVQFIQTLRSKQEFYSVTELLNDIIEQTGYVKDLEAEDTEEARERIENIDELINKAAAYDETAEEPSLSGFLEEVALVADIDSLDDEGSKVVLMTLHSAKGLEFPQVYLAGMEDGLFPSYMCITSDDPDDVEEERRLCYVGITRAMKELTMTAAQTRMIRGQTQYNKMSRFIREIPEQLLQTEDKGKRSYEMRTARPVLEENEQSEGMNSRSPEENKTVHFGTGQGYPETAKKKTYQQAREAFRARAFEPKQFQVKKAEGLDYEVGDTVSHIKFGTGIVQKIAEGGRDYEVTVDFEKAGVKKMFASFAKLKKL